MSFSAPTVPKPKIKAGWIYAIRDEDYLDQSISRYVKLGLTERTVAQRIREHQTGNPRREFEAINSKYIELMNYGEKYLHHVFAPDRIAGEWFDMDDAGLVTDVDITGTKGHATRCFRVSGVAVAGRLCASPRRLLCGPPFRCTFSVRQVLVCRVASFNVILFRVFSSTFFAHRWDRCVEVSVLTTSA